MSDKFDAIIVGAGVAGTIAGYILAKEGLEVLVVERGNSAGSKNMTGGRLYSHSLEKIMPDFAKGAPVQRKVTHEKISFLTDESAVTMEFHSADKLGIQGKDSYTVVRAEFDQWLAEKAEEAGAQVIPGIRVDDLLIVNGRVSGIIAGGDELEAEVVILADGVNSLLAEKIGYVKPVSPHSVAVGAKEVIKLPQKVLEDRFAISEDEGTAWLFVGPSNGVMGGGFLYTNKDTISLGVVVGLHDIDKQDKSVPQMVEDFKNHPTIKELVKDGELVEYSAHLVPEAGINMLPKIVGDGVLVVGDAAGFCINLGYSVRGMDFAIASAECAAKAVLNAREKGDYSESTLSLYHSLLEDSFVMKDLEQYKKFPDFLGQTTRMFNEYPTMVEGMMTELFVVDGQQPAPIMKKMMRHIKPVGLMQIAKDGLKGVRSL